MRLTTIKLAGFKSFVDPTTLHLPTNMTGVVGPNGCGKSNIIDAIRWVMGESAASRLRGDALTDVIFSGSSARKPVGAATVELQFDNSDGLIAGEYAGYNEISVKRSVSRDGSSLYFLNGARCRRRDIADIFLGTGLGPRSYSIIEQGMISQIVEAHPEQLRTHLEEAAGISKYKERRKETETRIKHTRENLDRVNDVRDEIEKQLDHLKRQARAAVRYQELKAEQRKQEAELHALNYRALDGELTARTQGLKQAELGVEALVADQRQVESQLEAHRERHVVASENLGTVQAEGYRIGADVARLEQQIQHNREMGERLLRNQRETEQAIAELDGHISADQKQIDTLRFALNDSEPRLAELNEIAERSAEALRDSEATIAAWQTRWDEHARSNSEAAQAAEVERTRLDYVEKQSLDSGKRLEVLRAEQQAADIERLTQAANELDVEHATQREKVETFTALLDERKSKLDAHQEEQSRAQAELAALRQQQNAARGRLASLEALQHAALGQEQGEAGEWLSRLGLGHSKRLGEVLAVESGWETAVETVLAGLLDGVLVESPREFAAELASVQAANIALVEVSDAAAGMAGSLAEKVRGPASVLTWLGAVRVAENLLDAQRIAGALRAGESVITANGEWLGAGFARVLRGRGSQLGVLAREREIQTLHAESEDLETRGAALIAKLDALKQAIVEAERQRDEAQRELYVTHRRLAELGGLVQSQRGRLEAAQTRLARVSLELEQVNSKLNEDQGQAKAARGRLEQAVARMADLEQARQKLDAERRRLLEQREEARAAAREARDQAHQIALGVESKRSALTSLLQALARMDTQATQMRARKDEIVAQLAAGQTPMAELEAERQTYLNQRLLVDKRQVEARRVVEDCDAEFRRIDAERHRVEHELNRVREEILAQRLEEQGLRMRAQAQVEAVQAAGFELEAVLLALSPEAAVEAWQTQLADLELKIRRLEPVNLAAIQEFEEQSQRKQYLDAQLTDLSTALETLENAIRKIDRETRQRFKETFDRVNTGLQELFPRLFGGGHAYLELTGEDLLSTGVTIMARPPGKRVTSISLLSGGEKALTAVALVFSIFRLNPAPFCLLDEVDAPLDEANVGRFCQMVTEMSERVQFLFVTHNKATMEAALQLAGVTMREPGVSRLVQVDLAEAAKLAGAA